MTTMKTTRRLLCTVVLAVTGSAGAHAASLELSDCDILIGKKSNAAYKDWLKDNQKEAEAGDRDAIRLRALEAHNRLACYEEKLTGDSGWGMTMTTADGSSETRQPPIIANVRKQQGAWRALASARPWAEQLPAVPKNQ